MNRCGCNHWMKPKCPANNCPRQGKRPVDSIASCAHRYLTSHGKGWECADCGVGILSLVVPLPMPLVVEALRALGLADGEPA